MENMENMEKRYKYLGEFVDVVLGITNALTKVVKEGRREDVIRLLRRYGTILRFIAQNIRENQYLGDFLRDLVVMYHMYKGCELGLIDALWNDLPSYIDEVLNDKEIQILSSMLEKFSSALSTLQDTISNDDLVFLLEKFGSSCGKISAIMETGHMVSRTLQVAKKFANFSTPTDYEGAKKLVGVFEKKLSEIWNSYDFEGI